eukprot:6197452-Pleurochrysis_carterae.AAC.1
MLLLSDEDLLVASRLLHYRQCLDMRGGTRARSVACRCRSRGTLVAVAARVSAGGVGAAACGG